MKPVRAILTATVAALCLSAQIPDFTPPTPLFRAVMRTDAPEVERLLAAGANPNEARFIGAPALVFAAMMQNPSIVRSLLGHGADIKATDRAGSTALMWAASNDAADTEMAKVLLTYGADPAVVNAMGDTALSWAMRRGHTPMVDLLKKHNVSETAMVKQAVNKAVALLQKSGPEFTKVSGCASCHHQSLPQMAYGRARERGFVVDSQISDKQVKAVIGMFKPYREQMLAGKENIPDPTVSVSYALIGLAAEGYPADATTEAMAHLISTQQDEDGSFRTMPGRPPMESSVISATALSLRALQLYGKDCESRTERAREYLVTANSRTTEERAMRLLGLAWAKADVTILQTSSRELLAEQRREGGWGQLPNLESDAYATGQALFALQTAGQLPRNDAAYGKATVFLLRTQRPDGSWFVKSRAFPFQPLKESGFPHGPDQWISAAGTSWAALALASTVPPVELQMSQAF